MYGNQTRHYLNTEARIAAELARPAQDAAATARFEKDVKEAEARLHAGRTAQ